MRIWIDADACPRPIKEVIFRASRKRRLPVTLVANALQQTPKLSWINAVQVTKELDAADAYIVKHSAPGDLVITQDIPLAAELIDKGVDTLGLRGEIWTASNIAERLSVRDFMTEVRASGVVTGGPPPFDDKAKVAFSNGFDRWLARNAPRPPA